MNAVNTSNKRSSKTKPVNGDLLPNVEGPALRFIALDVIEAKAQVRTEFHDDTLAELAADIKARGMLQPVLLRPAGDKFIIIAGERRIRAARLAELPAVPAIIGEVSDSQAENMQLAENIQREELSLNDLAAAVRKLYDREGKLDKVAAIVHKSKSWVSKHLSLSCPQFGYAAKQLLEDGVTDDLELLTTFNALDQVDYHAARELAGKIRARKAGRKEAREALANAKKEAEEYQAQQEKAKPAAAKKVKNEPPPFNPGIELHESFDLLHEENGPTVPEIISKYTNEQQASMVEHYAEDHGAGTTVKDMPPLEQMRALAAYCSGQYTDDREAAAFVLGARGEELTLAALLNECIAIWKQWNK